MKSYLYLSAWSYAVEMAALWLSRRLAERRDALVNLMWLREDAPHILGNGLEDILHHLLRRALMWTRHKKRLRSIEADEDSLYPVWVPLIHLREDFWVDLSIVSRNTSTAVRFCIPTSSFRAV